MLKISIEESGVNEVIKEKYSEDTILLIATARDNVPSVRSVDSLNLLGFSCYLIIQSIYN